MIRMYYINHIKGCTFGERVGKVLDSLNQYWTDNGYDIITVEVLKSSSIRIHIKKCLKIPEEEI